MSVFLWFVDGLGLGAADPQANPLAGRAWPGLSRILAGPPLAFAGLRTAAGAAAVALDPAMGVPGLPQSATGQTALLTGRNVARLVRRHINGYPTPTLVAALRDDNLFLRLVRAGRRVTFLNAFSREYLLCLEGHKRRLGWADTPAQEAVFREARVLAPEPAPPSPPSRRRFRPSASTVAADAAGLALRGPGLLSRGLAVPHDVTGHFPGGRGRLSVEQAVAAAARVWADHDLTFFEVFVTDLAGHAQDRAQALQVLERLDAFAAGLLEVMDPGRQTLVLISDHGNIEDLTVRTHTWNRVPFAAVGAGAAELVQGAEAIPDVMPRLLGLLGIEASGAGSAPPTGTA